MLNHSVTDPEGETPIPASGPGSRPRRKSRARPGSLKAWRLRRGINQRTAAEALGISQAYYSKLEREAYYARPKLAQRLRVLTGLSLETLLGIDL